MADKQYQILGDLIYNSLITTKNNPTEEIFAESFTNAIESFLEKADGTTVDKGTISSGVYAGVGTLDSIKGNISICKQTILDTCIQLKTVFKDSNSILASSMAEGIYKLGFNGKFKYKSDGVVSHGNTSTPLKGDMEGNFTINQTLLFTSLKSLFLSFNVRSNETLENYNKRLNIGTIFTDSDESFAYKFADILQPILSVGVVSTKGKEVLEGVSGTGVLLFKEKEEKLDG